MTKRFFDTKKFEDTWYRKLPSKYKLLWDYLLCSCDHAGVLKLDLDLASYFVGEPLEAGVAQELLKGRLTLAQGLPSSCPTLGQGQTYFIKGFIKFQYGKLIPSINVHKSVIARLKEVGIDPTEFLKENPCPTPVQELPKGSPGAKDKNKEKEKDKVKDILNSSLKENELQEIQTEEVQTAQAKVDFSKWLGQGNIQKLTQDLPPEATKKITPDEILDLWNSKMGQEFGFCQGLGGGKHRDNCLESLKYLPTLQHWSDLFDKCHKSKLLTGHNDSGWTVNIIWLVDYDNALKVLSDVYDDGKAMKNAFASMKSAEAV